MAIPERRLGSGGLTVSAQGLGCMEMSTQFYGPTGPGDDPESIATIRRAIDLGVYFLDTANAYGGGTNEDLISGAINDRRESVVLATKFGIVAGGRDGAPDVIDARPEYAKQCCDESLKRLRTDYIDLFYAHRLDERVPVEETVGAMAELVQEGKVRHLGLCEASAKSLERASAVHPIAALQSEWSLWTRDIEADVLPTARRLGIGIVAFSPLGRGLFTGSLNDRSEGFAAADFRAHSPRFRGENFRRNLARVSQLAELARARGITPAQLALAWLMAQGEDVVSIPGTKRRRHLEENAAGALVDLTDDELARLDEISPPGPWAGERYDHGSSYTDTPLPAGS